ncbi:MAG: hypothetical protein IJA83_07880 [Clostridia bacterium]|nr:hypothetical protein [Clostridia bacterium]
MKRILMLLIILVLLALPALAEGSFPGVWIETEGYGTLTIYADGSAIMEYYDGTVTQCPWLLTDEGAKFTEGQWFNSPMVLLDENTLSVSDGWMVFSREGFLPTTDQALLLGAQPVGEAGYPFCGTWVLEAIIADGETYDPAILGISLEMTLSSDGLCTSSDGMDVYTTTWYEAYGNAMVEGDVLILNEEGKLVMSAEDGEMIFTLAKWEFAVEEEPEEEIPQPTATPVPETEPEIIPEAPAEEAEITFTPVGEEGAPFLGAWTLEMLETGGMQLDPAMLGMSMTLTFCEDGSVTSDDGSEPSVSAWHVENGAAVADDLILTLNEEGKLIMDVEGDLMLFTKDEGKVAGELSEEEQLLALLALMMQLDETEASDGGEYLNTKFVCDTYSVSGITLDGSTLGAEYSVIFYEDNTADLTLGGLLMAGAPYTVTEEGVYAIDYYGIIHNCTPTDAGFDLDYYGTMTLHLIPAQ